MSSKRGPARSERLEDAIGRRRLDTAMLKAAVTRLQNRWPRGPGEMAEATAMMIIAVAPCQAPAGRAGPQVQKPAW